jgi:hypothetical protein
VVSVVAAALLLLMSPLLLGAQLGQLGGGAQPYLLIAAGTQTIHGETWSIQVWKSEKRCKLRTGEVLPPKGKKKKNITGRQ